MQRVEARRHEELRLGSRDVVSDFDAVFIQHELPDGRVVAKVTLPERGQQPRPVELVIVRTPDEPVLGRPPVEPRQKRRFARFGRAGERGAELRFGPGHLGGRRRGILLHLAEGVDRAVHAVVVG